MALVTGGSKAQQYLKDLAEKIGTAGTLRVGFLDGATYPDGTPVAEVAAIQNYGAPGASIPARPFFTNMIEAKSPTWGQSLANIAKNNGFDMKKTLGLMGEGISKQLQASIINTNAPPLSPVTLMLRQMRSDNPNLVVTAATVGEADARVKAGKSSAGVSTKVLNDTGHLLRSVGYEVK
jgi:hypothetical protein